MQTKILTIEYYNEILKNIPEKVNLIKHEIMSGGVEYIVEDNSNGFKSYSLVVEDGNLNLREISRPQNHGEWWRDYR